VSTTRWISQRAGSWCRPRSITSCSPQNRTRLAFVSTGPNGEISDLVLRDLGQLLSRRVEPENTCLRVGTDLDLLSFFLSLTPRSPVISDVPSVAPNRSADRSECQ
jgi:hypothetical protein